MKRSLTYIFLFFIALSIVFNSTTAKAIESEERNNNPYMDLAEIPEPMVFDLVRPLGARQGELEFNTLALFPLRDRGRSRSRRNTGEDDRIAPSTRDRIDWAPEIEYALFDDFALEFELPFEDDRLAAYKFAYQWTFGTAFKDKIIHGTQGIIEYDRVTEISELTFLYIFGSKLSTRWNSLSMLGVRAEAGGKVERGPTEIIFNNTLFYTLNDNHSLGLETNVSLSYRFNENRILLMPQWEWQIKRFFSIQSGAGAEISDERTLPLLGTRVIFNF